MRICQIMEETEDIDQQIDQITKKYQSCDFKITYYTNLYTAAAGCLDKLAVDRTPNHPIPHGHINYRDKIFPDTSYVRKLLGQVNKANDTVSDLSNQARKICGELARLNRRKQQKC